MIRCAIALIIALALGGCWQHQARTTIAERRQGTEQGQPTDLRIIRTEDASGTSGPDLGAIMSVAGAAGGLMSPEGGLIGGGILGLLAVAFREWSASRSRRREDEQRERERAEILRDRDEGWELALRGRPSPSAQDLQT